MATSPRCVAIEVKLQIKPVYMAVHSAGCAVPAGRNRVRSPRNSSPQNATNLRDGFTGRIYSTSDGCDD